jgi:hypothetical protein
MKRGCRLAWSRLVASGAIDAGSNPASPTNFLLVLKENKMVHYLLKSGQLTIPEFLITTNLKTKVSLMLIEGDTNGLL